MARVVAATEAAAQVAAEAAPPPVGPPAQSVALKRGGRAIQLPLEQQPLAQLPSSVR